MGDRPPPILPVAGERNILITSALPYCNNAPHLGNIIGCVLSADVFARYCRLRGFNTLYICGTDEYGTTTEIKAMQENCTPREICDKYHALHSEVYKWFDISFDEFGRTSNPQHAGICHQIFNKLLENNYLSENTMQQFFCDPCEKFLADRFVVGTCPDEDCNGAAKGDECDKCQKSLNPTDLKDPKCSICGSPPRIRDTSHLFLELPLLQDRLVEYVDRTSGSWSNNAVRATDALINQEGLKNRCITRDLKWGVPVPHERFRDKVFYVWFDAPIGYVSITACYAPDDWEKWWKNPDDVELYQFMGKDNIKFHTALFPSYLLGTGENWTMMKTVSVTEYLNYEKGKFSKSKGVGVFGTDVKEIEEIPVEVWRYYLLANRPEVSDTKFSWSDLEAKLNTELCNNLGNFINRVLSLLAKPRSNDGGVGYSSIVPDVARGAAESHLLTKNLGDEVEKNVVEYVEAMKEVKLKQGLKTAMAISSQGNAYLQKSGCWKKLPDKDPQQLASRDIVIRTSAGLVYLLACLLEPFMPSFTVEVLKQLDLVHDPASLCDEKKGGVVDKANRPWEIIPSGHRIGVPKPLFKKLKEGAVKGYQSKYGGTQEEREERDEAPKVKEEEEKEEKKKKL